MAEETKTYEDRLNNAFRPIKKLMKKKGWDWNIKTDINAYPEIVYALTYAPIRWSNGTRNNHHICDHTTHGLDYIKQPMTKVTFSSSLELYHWVADLPFASMESQITMILKLMHPVKTVRACSLCKGHWMVDGYRELESIEVEELECDYEKCPNYEFKISEENETNKK